MNPVELNPALRPPDGMPRPVAPPATTSPEGPAFGQVLDVTFSKHASQRVQRRGLSLDRPTLERLDDALSRAAAKGARDTVVLLGDVAFVCSVPNRTVITAVGRDQLRDHVFTNIDSAVFS
ncbi:TIGR02530 family flagellar biosynthesis protein [Conexibacter sp. SYSU D00693]|uniref:TIGR02530 family flagellar biosynthesis protein n=1 Tax=Conexibacter sp. SYSU D00693 TaxID=2812560 RepID=UPI00196ADE19|nr:TIGR02530 family flagellar biosynthesis protein [Conexibacter sp. SYSU D00693]